jgi:hypothetical protein
MKYLFSLFILVFIGCSSNPLNIPDEIWLNMSDEKKIQAYEQQASLNLQREQNRQIELELRAKEEKQQQLIYESQLANASYGDRLQCIVYDAKAKLNKKIRDINYIGLDLLKNNIQEFKIVQNTSSSRRYSSVGYALFNGIELRMCEDSNMRRNCTSVVGTFMDFSRGINTHLNNDDFIIGKIKCEFVPTPNSNIIIRH